MSCLSKRFSNSHSPHTEMVRTVKTEEIDLNQVPTGRSSVVAELGDRIVLDLEVKQEGDEYAISSHVCRGGPPSVKVSGKI